MIHSAGLLTTIVSFALLIGPLIFLHEMGHYLVGRAFGVKAEIFSIGFGPELLGRTDRRGTRWKLSLFPLGGYVRFAGDMNPASVPDAAWLSLPAEERARTFQAKPLWQRALIVVAGPVANFLIAALLLTAIATQVGSLSDPAVVGAVSERSAAASAGLQPGDHIVGVDGHRVPTFAQLTEAIRARPGAAVKLQVERAGGLRVVAVTLGTIAGVDEHGKLVRIGQLGVSPQGSGIVEALGRGVSETAEITRMTVAGLGPIFTGRASVKELGGPLRIAAISGQSLEAGWLSFLSVSALVSINLGFINLLPVPVLDGGHLLFYAVEAVRRRPLGPRAVELAFGGGLVAILALVVLVTVNDLGAFGLWKHLAGLIG